MVSVMLTIQVRSVLVLLLFGMQLSSLALAQSPRAVLPSGNHDFGTVKQGQRLTHVLSIRNTGSAPLRIERIELDAPGITTRFKPDVPPGGEGTITLEWDTTQANGEAQAIAEIHLNDPDRPEIPYQLRAVVKAPIEFLPYPAVFFAAYQDETPEKRVKLVNNEEIPLHIEQIEFPQDHYEVGLDTIEPGKVYELRVKVRAGVPLGRYSEPIYLLTNRSQKPRLQVLANLFVKPDFYTFPESVNFGSLSLEALDRQPQLLEMLTQIVIVTNRSGPVEIQSVHSDLPFLQISRTPASGTSERFRFDIALIRNKMQRGKIAGTIRVTTNDPKLPELSIPMSGEVR